VVNFGLPCLLRTHDNHQAKFSALTGNEPFRSSRAIWNDSELCTRYAGG